MNNELKGGIVAATTVVLIVFAMASCTAYEARQRKEIVTACIEKTESPLECALFDNSRMTRR